MDCLSQKFKRNKKWLFLSLLAVFLWGILAHGYGFMHDSFSHDSLNEFNGANGGNAWKIQLGRFVIPVYKAVFRTDLTLPWLVGILSLLWIGLAVFLVIRIFKIESKVLVFLIAGIFTANLTVAATSATYMHDFDCDMFALLCSVLAMYFWRNVRRGGLLGAIFVAISLGIYQSYLSVTIVLVMFVCILDLLNGEKFKSVFCKGLKAVGMILLGGGIYFAAMQVVLAFTGLELASGDYNSLGNLLELTPRSILSLTYCAYLDCYARLVSTISPYPAVLVKGSVWLMFLAAAAAVLAGLWNKRMGVLEKLLCIALVVLLPLGMNLIYILAGGEVHDLMVYAVWLFYLLVLLLLDWLGKHCNGKSKPLSGLCMVLIFVLLYGNVQTANALYLKKDMEQDAFLSLMTRVVYKMEECDEYEPGQTPVVFVGNSDQLNGSISGFEKYSEITGAWDAETANMTEDFRCRTYFQYVLNNPALIASGSVWEGMQTDSRVSEMPCYPSDGCIAMIDGVLVVKLGSNS